MLLKFHGVLGNLWSEIEALGRVFTPLPLKFNGGEGKRNYNKNRYIVY